jgi:hypothetical protein
MKKLFYAFILSAGLCVSASAATGYFGNAFVVTNQGAGNIFDEITSGTTPGLNAGGGIDLAHNTGNPEFSAYGTFNRDSDTFDLKGFEYNTFEDGGSALTDGFMFYRV